MRTGEINIIYVLSIIDKTHIYSTLINNNKNIISKSISAFNHLLESSLRFDLNKWSTAGND